MKNPNSGHSDGHRDKVVTIATRRLIIACVVVFQAFALWLEMERHAPGWLYIAPVTGIACGLLYLASTRRCR